ncbi:MAG TPA: DUF29 domain-containing protein [Methylobacterium sp.]|jgi:hypothetical protein
MGEPALRDTPRAGEPTGASSSCARYEDDLYTWVQEQVALLRAGAVDGLDLGNLAEELGDVGAEQYHRLQSALENLLMPMLRWDHQPERRSRSWVLSIVEHRERISIVLRKNPGLKPYRTEAVQDGFRLGRVRAAREMKRDLETLPTSCPYSWDDILSRSFVLDSDS